MKKIVIVGCGQGSLEFVTPAAVTAFRRADVLIGAKSVLALFEDTGAERIEFTTDTRAAIEAVEKRRSNRTVAVLVSGDPGIYSLGGIIVKHFGREACMVIPGISSVQLASARIGLDWADAYILNAHHKNPQQRFEACGFPDKIAILSGKTESPGWIAALLKTISYEKTIFACENLGLDNENISEIDGNELSALIRDMNIEAVVDVTHPYASEITALASSVSSACGLPYYRYSRPPVIQKAPDIFFEKDHDAAAATAFSFGTNVLLTTGSKNLAPYVKEALRTNIRLVARVLSTEDSIRACLDAGIGSGWIVTGKGPFSVADNLSLIRKFAIGVLVTKDGGVPGGGVLEKLEAARTELCRIVIVERAPDAEVEGRTWMDIDKFLDVLDCDLGS